jgi:hypothetical protein
MKVKLKLDDIKELKDEELKSSWSGTVEFETLKYTDRLKLMKKCNFKAGSTGAIEGIENLDGASTIAETAVNAITSINATYTSGEKKCNITGVEMLEEYAFGTDVISIIGNRLMTGLELGEC